MKNTFAIKMIHHNRCVVIPAEQLTLAGISKGDYVVVRPIGDRLCIEKARLVLDDPACANQHEALESPRQ